MVTIVKFHQTFAILLSPGELNEIWGHYHSSGTDHAVLKFKASVDTVQVTTHDAPPDDEQTGEGSIDDDFYDEDGDEEYECPAPKRRLPQTVDIMDYHTSVKDESVDSKKEAPGDDLAQQVMDYVREITKFSLTKSDMDTVLTQAKQILDGAEMESAKIEIDKIMKEFDAVNGEAEQRLKEGGGEDVLLWSADPSQLQAVFNTYLKEYLQTEEGQKYRSDNAESALKHKMDAYDNFPADLNMKIALDGATKDTIKNIVNEFVKFENVRLQFDKVNPLHEMNENANIPQSDSVSKSNQDMSRTKPSDADSIDAEETNVAIDHSEITSNDDDNIVDDLKSDSDESHIPQESPEGDSHVKSAFGHVVDPQTRQRLEMMQQRHEQLRKQMVANQKTVQENTDESQRDSKQKAKEEL